MSECDLCRRDTELTLGTVLAEESIPGEVWLCGDCWGRLDRPRCALCGATDVAGTGAGDRALNSVYSHSKNVEGPLCESCLGLLEWERRVISDDV